MHKLHNATRRKRGLTTFREATYDDSGVRKFYSAMHAWLTNSGRGRGEEGCPCYETTYFASRHRCQARPG
jgi:hypothetical protein